MTSGKAEEKIRAEMTVKVLDCARSICSLLGVSSVQAETM